MAINERQRALLDTYAPVKIGVLGYNGENLEQFKGARGGGVPLPVKLALDEAIESGRMPRRYELIFQEENGFPEGTSFNTIRGYHELCDKDCCVILGPHSSDNVYQLLPHLEQRRVPVISWCGTERLASPYAFRLGNGDCGGDSAFIASYCEKRNMRRVAVIEELCPNGEEYMRYFRLECRQRGIQIVATETVSQCDGNIPEALARLRDTNPDALVYQGYGMLLKTNLLNPALKEIGWEPPVKLTTTAFMNYLVGYEFFEGWTGVDQDCPENPLRNHFKEAFYARYKDECYLEHRPNWLNGVQLLAYDGGRVVAEAIARAPHYTPSGLLQGLESIRWLPSCVGGARNHISASKNEHNLYSGDWLVWGEIKDGIIRYVGTYEG